MKDGLGGSFMDMMVSGMDKNGGGQVSTRRRSRNCATDSKDINVWICLLSLQKLKTNFPKIKPLDNYVQTDLKESAHWN